MSRRSSSDVEFHSPPQLVCIDGPAGSGKTTWAAGFLDRMRSVGTKARLVHLDDTYEGWDGLFTVAPRLRDELVVPWMRDRIGSYARYDWVHHEFGPRIWVYPAEVLILEGVGAGDRCLEDLRTFLVWVEAPPEVCKERWAARDGEESLAHWDAWKRDEQVYFAENGLPGTANMHIANW